MEAASLGYLTRLPKFEYLEPKAIGEVCTLLSTYGKAAKMPAGGIDLLVLVSMKKSSRSLLRGY